MSTWYNTEGGPFVVVSSQDAPAWTGVSGDDYRRACNVFDEVETIQVGDGTAIVLGDEPHQTALQNKGTELWMIRWVYAEDESVVWDIVSKASSSDFTRREGTWDVRGEDGALMFDAALAGKEAVDQAGALKLPAGKYTIETARLEPNDETCILIHRFRAYVPGEELS